MATETSTALVLVPQPSHRGCLDPKPSRASASNLKPNRPWTAAEIDQLVKYFHSKMTYREMAEAMNRPWNGLRKKLWRMKLRRPEGGVARPAEEMERIKRQRSRNLSLRIMENPEHLPHAFGYESDHYLIRKLAIIEDAIATSVMQAATRAQINYDTVRSWVYEYREGELAGTWESMYHTRGRGAYKLKGKVPIPSKRKKKVVFVSHIEKSRCRAEVLVSLWATWSIQKNSTALRITNDSQVEFCSIFDKFIKTTAFRLAQRAKDSHTTLNDLVAVGTAETLANMHRWAKIQEKQDGRNFSTTICKRAISSAMIERYHILERNVKVPSEVLSGALKLAQSMRNKGEGVSDDCAIEEFKADAIASGNYSPGRLERVLEYRNLIQEQTLSIVEETDEESGEQLGLLTTRLAEDNVDFDNLSEFLESVINQMVKSKRITARDAEWVKRRNGFGAYAGAIETFDEIGQRSRVSRERVRQVVARSMNKIRDRMKLLGIQKTSDLLT